MASARERQPLEPGRARGPTGRAHQPCPTADETIRIRTRPPGRPPNRRDGEGAYALFADTDVGERRPIERLAALRRHA
jgi:hypothetical protein